MQRRTFDSRIRETKSRTNLTNRLVYLPGALVLAYGFWLTLTI